MAHRPIARTDLRTKSTSTSVAYLQKSLKIIFLLKKKKKKSGLEITMRGLLLKTAIENHQKYRSDL